MEVKPTQTVEYRNIMHIHETRDASCPVLFPFTELPCGTSPFPSYAPCLSLSSEHCLIAL
jgi:hypothetical protein